MVGPSSNPYVGLPRQSSFLWRLASPTAAGACGAALLAAPRPRGWLVDYLSSRLDGVSGLETLQTVVRQPLFSVGWGFLLGYIGYQVVQWLRWRALKALLQSRGWLLQPTSFRTKVWALCVKWLEGPGPHNIWKFQSILPHQHLPELDETLEKWLDVSKLWVSADDHAATTDAVEDFKKNEGPRLQAHLRHKADHLDSWLADYWTNAAYLSQRDSLLVGSNPFYISVRTLSQPPPDQLQTSAAWIRNKGRFIDHVLKGEILAEMIQDLIPVCMSGFKYCSGTLRQPGYSMDNLITYSSTHVNVFRKGHFFKLELYAPSEEDGKPTLLTQPEIHNQLVAICKAADGLDEAAPVAVLTTQNRVAWAKDRDILEKRNSVSLQALETSMFNFAIEDRTPKNAMECARSTLVGKGDNRWCDKCFTTICFPNGYISHHAEHTPKDATIFMTITEFCTVHDNYIGGKYSDETSGTPRTLPEPQHLTWDVTDVSERIQACEKEFQARDADVDIDVFQTKYGKGFMKKQRVSPDGYIQAALLLAFYRLHKTMPRMYEPATGRLFYLGRTENLYPGSSYSMEFNKAMDSPSSSIAERQALLRKAIKVQTQAKVQATAGLGCDRHLLGLYCASRELGMDVPRLFLDKAWRAPFRLSTSQTPTRIVEYLGGSDAADFSWNYGGFGQVSPDGYGISYLVVGDDIINVSVCTSNSCDETSSSLIHAAIDDALEDMKRLFI